MKRIAVKFALILFTLSMFFALPLNVAHADGEEDDGSFVCDNVHYLGPGAALAAAALGCGWDAVSSAFPDLDIRKTITNFFFSMFTDVPSSFLNGLSPEQLAACTVWELQQHGLCTAEPDDDIQGLIDSMDKSICAGLESNPVAAAAGLEAVKPVTGPFSGSLMGLATHGTNVLYQEPIPVNLAFYAKDLASHTMFLKNTAFAQEIDTSNFAGFPVILNIWKLTRNLAFGLMAVFMLVTGVMIMMRKQIDPRTSVTIQYAIPRIIIVLVLIAFSYAIGALGVALIRPLASVALEPIRQVTGVTLSPALTWAAITYGAFNGVGQSFTTVLLIIIATAVLVLLFLMLIIKGLMAYIKILVGVITAPIQFAWGAIPGNEESITNWFKTLAVNVLTIPVVTAGIAIGLAVAWSALATNACATPAFLGAGGIGGVFSSNGTGTVIGNQIVSMAVPIMVMAVFVWANGLPQKLEEALLGDKKKPGGKK